MKTWFCRDSQKWVSELPRSFWTGEVDYITGEKIYSDDIWLCNTGNSFDWYTHEGIEKLIDARMYKNYVKYGLFPYTHIYGRGLYKKVLCKKIENI